MCTYVLLYCSIQLHVTFYGMSLMHNLILISNAILKFENFKLFKNFPLHVLAYMVINKC
jgi:hypothetical protein